MVQDANDQQSILTLVQCANEMGGSLVLEALLRHISSDDTIKDGKGKRRETEGMCVCVGGRGGGVKKVLED